MNRSRKGFILVEAVAAVVVVSVCLTMITQTLLTNFHAGMRFAENTRALMAMENRMGIIWVSPWSKHGADAQELEPPYEQLTLDTDDQELKDDLHQVSLTLAWASAKGQHALYATTFIYDQDQAKTKSYTQ